MLTKYIMWDIIILTKEKKRKLQKTGGKVQWNSYLGLDEFNRKRGYTVKLQEIH